MIRIGRAGALLALVFTAGLAPVDIAAVEIRVLVLSSHHNGLPWTDGFEQGLREYQAERPEILYYFEYMYATRGDVSFTDEEWAGYLRAKYRDVQLDAIIADSGRAAALLQRFDRLFGPIPQVLVADSVGAVPDYQFSLRPDIENALITTARFALSQNPEAATAIVIDQGYIERVVSLGPLYSALDGASLQVTALQAFSIDDLVDTLRRADPAAIAFYAPVFVDETGVRVAPAVTLARVAEGSAVPIYTFWSTLVGNGAVGGQVIDAPSMGYSAMNAALRYLETGSFGSGYITTLPVFDDRVIRRHGIDPNTLPDDAILLNRLEPFFRTHYTESITVVSVAALAALAVVVVLLRKNIRKNGQLQSQGLKLEAIVAEKELLFREMNHRVKNNINILTSLVSLQMSATEDETSRGHLADVAGKLRTMSLIHAKLQQEGDGAGFNTGEYLRALVNQVFQAIRPSAATIRLELNLQPIEMDVKAAVPCGLIVNELLTNALKYAFPGPIATGCVFVELVRPTADTVRLSVGDDGAGLPPEFDLDRDGGLGLKVVESLARQLGGTLTIAADTGTTITIDFPAEAPEKVSRVPPGPESSA